MPREKFERDENERLPDFCADCLMLVLQLRAAKEFGDATVLRRRIKDLFDRLERNTKRAGIEFEDVQMAKFALVAFIDETIIGSQWSQKDAWLALPLQLELFNRYDAGEEFFVRLDQLRQRPQANVDVLEVYYLCMVLGFKGKYQLQETERLRLLIEDTYNDLRRAAGGRVAEILSPNGKRRDEIAEVVTKEIPLWVIGVTAAAVGFLFFIIMTLFINGSAETVKRVIE
jgi:type VI secretion system protein ImpK